MATVTPSDARLAEEHRFFLAMALALAICTFVGFARTYYLMRYTGAAELAPFVHLHGAVFTAWILLFGAQAGLISAQRTDIHVWTGAMGVILALAMIVLGIIVAITRSAVRRPGSAPRLGGLVHLSARNSVFRTGCHRLPRHRRALTHQTAVGEIGFSGSFALCGGLRAIGFDQ